MYCPALDATPRRREYNERDSDALVYVFPDTLLAIILQTHLRTVIQMHFHDRSVLRNIQTFVYGAAHRFMTYSTDQLHVILGASVHLTGRRATRSSRMHSDSNASARRNEVGLELNDWVCIYIHLAALRLRVLSGRRSKVG